MLEINGQIVGLSWGLILPFVPHLSMVQSQTLVDIESNDMGVAVYADSLHFGHVSGGPPYRVDPPTRTIRLSTFRTAAWSIPPIQTHLKAEPGDAVQVSLNFPYYHRIESHPFGVEAWIEEGAKRKSLGRTPVVFTTSEEGRFHVELEGSIPGVVKSRADIWNRYEITTEALTPTSERSGLSFIVRNRRSWIDWSTATVAVEVVAVHHEFRAGRINDQYLETGDASLHPWLAELDDYFGIVSVR